MASGSISNGDRIEALLDTFPDIGIDWLVVSSEENRRYLSGFTGSSGWLVLARNQLTLITDSRYQEQAAHEAPGFDVQITRTGLHGQLRSLITQSPGVRVGYESDHLTVREFGQLSEPAANDSDATNGDQSSGIDAHWVPTYRLIEKSMATKDASEIEIIARASAFTDQLFSDILKILKPGTSERFIATELEYRARMLGGDGLAFDPIVASGERASLPHARPSDRLIESGDMVTLDFGVRLSGYASDMTRTVAVGTASEQFRNIYAIVHEAQVAALDAVAPGVNCVELDGIARDIIGQAGHSEHFGHGLGHGVGLRIHELPTISYRSKNEVLAENMVITIEPGIYIPGWGGVRIEDTAVVTASGRTVLNNATKDLMIID
jgi:Xaa-Pro aminopeptidase